MVVDHLPLATLTTVDVGDTLLDGDPLARQRELPLLDTDLVGQICTDADQLVGQPNLSPLAREPTWSNADRTCSQPSPRSPMGCMAVTSPPCAQAALIALASPLAIWFSAA